MRWGERIPPEPMPGVELQGTRWQPHRWPLPHPKASPHLGGSEAGAGFAGASTASGTKLAAVELGKAGTFWQDPRWECCFAGLGTTESPHVKTRRKGIWQIVAGTWGSPALPGQDQRGAVGCAATMSTGPTATQAWPFAATLPLASWLSLHQGSDEEAAPNSKCTEEKPGKQ